MGVWETKGYFSYRIPSASFRAAQKVISVISSKMTAKECLITKEIVPEFLLCNSDQFGSLV